MKQTKPRDFAPDAVRIGAFCLLLWLHFFLRNGFYYEPVDDVWSFIACSMRPVFMCCVPLFLTLTGYLKCGKELKKGYYRSLLPILCSWVIISGIFLLYKIFHLHEQHSAWYWLCNFFDFKLANYSWYIEMYIGLFLLSPFINAAWNRLTESGKGSRNTTSKYVEINDRNCAGNEIEKEAEAKAAEYISMSAGKDTTTSAARTNHRILLLTMILLTSVATTFNGLDLLTIGEDRLEIFPAYFTGLYYVTYYLLGCYLRTYPYKKGWILPLGGIAFIAALLGTLNTLSRTEPNKFMSGFNCNYSNLFTLLLTLLLFCFFASIRTENRRIKSIAAVISSCILEAYLLSWLFDTNIYVIGKGSYGPEKYLVRGLLSTGAVFILSVASGLIVHKVSALICRK